MASLREQGNAAFRAADFSKAVSFYKRAIDEKPPDSQELGTLYNNRAACYLSLEQFKDAENDANRALECMPSNAKAWSRLGQANFGLNQLDAAINSMQKALENDPENNAYKTYLDTYLLNRNQQEGGGGTSGAAASSSSAGAGGFASPRTMMIVNMVVLVAAVVHLPTMLFAPDIGMIAWRTCCGAFGLRQALGMLATRAFPKLDMSFFSNMTSNFFGQYLILGTILFLMAPPPIHLLMVSFCSYCLVDMLQSHKQTLDGIVAKLPESIRGWSAEKLEAANQNRHAVLVNAAVCEVMATIFAPLAGVSLVIVFIMAQFLKWRYQSDAMTKQAWSALNQQITQLTYHQYCPGVVRTVYVKVSELIFKYGGQ